LHSLFILILFILIILIAAKLRGDQQRLKAADPFALWASSITGPHKDLEGISVDDFPQKNLFVVLSTDKGLCGGVNTIMSRNVRNMLHKLKAAGKDYQLFMLGDKCRGQMRRGFGDKYIATATERQVPLTFDANCAFAGDILANGGDFDAVHICYNEFVSAIAYTSSIKTITPLLDPTSEVLYPFEVEPENDPETLQNFFEYTFATQLWHSLMENATSEQSSRMNAMENASKNAGEMIEKLSLQYNRARQARITTELIEIISGASALKG